MYRFLLFTCLLLNVVSLSAQTNITIGSPYKVIDAGDKRYFHHGDVILTVKVEKGKLYVQKIDAKTLALQKATVYDDLPRNSVIEEIAKIGSRIFVFYSHMEDKKELLSYREIDFREGTFVGMGVKFLSNDKKLSDRPVVTDAFYNTSVNLKYGFYYSRDTSRVLVQYRFDAEEKRDSKSYDVIGMQVFDRNLKKVWDKNVTLPYSKQKMDNGGYSVDGKGNVYVVAYVFEKEITSKWMMGVNYGVEVIKIAASTATITTSKAESDRKFIQTTWMVESPLGEMICAGFYNKGRGIAGTADGIVMFKLDSDGKVSDLKTFEIPLTVLNQYSSKDNRKSVRVGTEERDQFSDMFLRDILTEKDGSIILLAEQEFSSANVVGAGRSSSSNIVSASGTVARYYYHDIFATKITPDGKVAWMKKLPKRQTGARGKGGMSYAHVRGNAQHYFIFLDTEKNKNLPITETPDIYNEQDLGILTAYSLDDKTGDFKRISILDTRNTQGKELAQFGSSRVQAISPGVFVFEAYKKGKEDVMVRVDLNEKK
jgi:hypothetical protein